MGKNTMSNSKLFSPRRPTPRWAALAAGIVCAAAACLQTMPAATADRPSGATIEGCTVTLIDQAEVPAKEPGVLTAVAVKEGQQVSEGELLAQIDDAKTKMEVKVAEAKLAVAKVKSSDDINVRYARTSAEVADADYRVNADANRQQPGAVPAEVLREKRLKYTEASLGIEKSKLDMNIAKYEADEAQAEVDAAKENLNRHQILSPLNGLVVKLHRHKGEWVQPGDPLLHVIRIDHLWVEGFANTARLSPNILQNLKGHEALVTVTLAGGRLREFPAKVVFVDPEIQTGSAFLVRVEVQNVEEGGSWVLGPGLSASITIPSR
jgi:multidrug efflux pump subunit AcrA (membrane-fusion protein)